MPEPSPDAREAAKELGRKLCEWDAISGRPAVMQFIENQIAAALTAFAVRTEKSVEGLQPGATAQAEVGRVTAPGPVARREGVATTDEPTVSAAHTHAGISADDLLAKWLPRLGDATMDELFQDVLDVQLRAVEETACDESFAARTESARDGAQRLRDAGALAQRLAQAIVDIDNADSNFGDAGHSDLVLSLEHSAPPGFWDAHNALEHALAQAVTLARYTLDLSRAASQASSAAPSASAARRRVRLAGEELSALRALYEAEGHDVGCAFSGCSCGAVGRRADARQAAARELRNVAPR